MRLLWLCVLFLLSFMIPSHTLHIWDAPSILSSLVHNGFESENLLEKRFSRQKRAVVLQEYTVDIELSFPNASLLNQVRDFISQLRYPIQLNTSDSVNITSVTVTTACTQTGPDLLCSCESGYKWPSEVCNTYNACTNSSGSCGCISQLPPQGLYCEPKAQTFVNIKMSIKIEETFTSDFTNPSSKKYTDYKQGLEKAFNENYKSLPGFQSAIVTGFRQGSVVADYVVVTEPASTAQIQTANNEVIANLNKTFKLSEYPIQNQITGYNNITVTPSVIYTGDNVSLKCVLNVSSASAAWYINGTQKISNTSKYSISTFSKGSESTLNIYNVAPEDQGFYTCMMEQLSDVFVADKAVQVYPLVMKQLNTEVVCDKKAYGIVRCCTEGINSTFTLFCSITGSPAITGVSEKNGNCVTYSINASADQCTAPITAGPIIYKYTCDSGAGAVRSIDVQVTFKLMPQLEILQKNLNVSDGMSISLNCISNTNNNEDIIWEITNGNTKAGIDTAFYKKIGKNESVLTINRATISWEGIYTCRLKNDNEVAANSSVKIYRLISSSQIVVSPSKGTFACSGESSPPVPLECCVDNITDYTAEFYVNGAKITAVSKGKNCFNTSHQPDCKSDSITAYCNISNPINNFVRSSDMIISLIQDPKCSNPPGNVDSIINVSCSSINPSQTGYIISQCIAGNWKTIDIRCVSAALNSINIQSETLSGPLADTRVPTILNDLNAALNNEKGAVSNSTNNLKLVVNILTTVEGAATVVKEVVMQSFLKTVNIVVDNSSRTSWEQNANRTAESSRLLQSIEKFAEKLQIVNGSVNIATTNVILSGVTKTDLMDSYKKTFSFAQSNISISANVSIGNEQLNAIATNSSIVSIAYGTLNDILSISNSNQSGPVVNGLLLTTIVSNTDLTNFRSVMVFKKSNSSLNKGDCVFWNFNLSDWDSAGCRAEVSQLFVTCHCTHLTSFSILMSRFEIIDPFLDLITYIGVGISMLSLVICIIVEATVWKLVTKNKTSYMRHICLVNIAVSLLVANIWFIVGSGVRPQPSKENPAEYEKISDACVAATFFSHFFYLSVFFWMLTMGLILFYRLVYVLHDMSKSTMMALSFVMGYVCPLIIAVITIAVTITQPNKPYTAKRSCWLNIEETNAFIAFIVPALAIVLVNFIIVIIVIVKLLRPKVGDKTKKDEKDTLMQIMKSIVILTPLLGLTWGLGIGTIVSDSRWFQGFFSAINSLQGLFILLFGCLLDKKVRESLLKTFSFTRWASQQTKTTNASSSTDTPFSKGVFNLFGRKDHYKKNIDEGRINTGAYNISSAQMSSSSEPSSNSYSLLN
ncbi:adhesion G protein-coupled receptor F5-like [Bombina bombina]|uniref:adhesion G protein-coupled receptor F5-like n=1 Tax=Bombina bombina TaxID=8345 RepID=UPI00235B02BF|nr:adhesion G protein-coupled receptor F5-like [Bombina bombina]